MQVPSGFGFRISFGFRVSAFGFASVIAPKASTKQHLHLVQQTARLPHGVWLPARRRSVGVH
jgi:hypothetical protein